MQKTSTVAEAADTSLKSKSLIALKALCQRIQLPSFTNFKKIIESKDAVLEDGITLNSLYYDWPEFYEFENTIANVIAVFSDNVEETAYLNAMETEYKQILLQFEELKKSRPDPKSESDSIMIATSYYGNHLGNVYSQLQAFIAELKNHYLSCTRETFNSLQASKKQKAFSHINNSTKKERKLPPETKQLTWQENAEGFISNSKAILLKNRISLSTLSKRLVPNGPIRYMRKGRRCKVQINDFMEHFNSQISQDSFSDAAVEKNLKQMEQVKANIQQSYLNEG